jgi:hypothetical protein
MTNKKTISSLMVIALLFFFAVYFPGGALALTPAPTPTQPSEAQFLRLQRDVLLSNHARLESLLIARQRRLTILSSFVSRMPAAFVQSDPSRAEMLRAAVNRHVSQNTRATEIAIQLRHQATLIPNATSTQINTISAHQVANGLFLHQAAIGLRDLIGITQIVTTNPPIPPRPVAVPVVTPAPIRPPVVAPAPVRPPVVAPAPIRLPTFTR